MQPARHGGIANGFPDGHGESDDVVFYARFEFIDPRDVGLGTRTDGRRGLFGHLAGLGEGVRSGQLDVEPPRKFVRVAPDTPHLFAGITWNQFRSLWSAAARR